MKIWSINQVQGSNLFTVVASAAIMASLAVAASVVFVSIVGGQTVGSAPPEHEVKTDLFDGFESQANSAAASFSPRSPQTQTQMND